VKDTANTLMHKNGGRLGEGVEHMLQGENMA